MSNLVSNSTTAQLAITQLPTDNTKIVTSAPKELAISDRTLSILEQYRPNVIQVATSETTADAVTAFVPVDLVIELRALFESFSKTGFPVTAEAATQLSLLIRQTQGTQARFTRRLWKLLSSVSEEQKSRECDINKLSAAMRAMAMPISTDVTTEASEDLLDTAISTAIALPDVWLDSDFQEENSDIIDPIVPVETVIADVMTNNAATVGVPPYDPPTNIVAFEPAEDSENIPIVDVDRESEILHEVTNGMKDLFSTGTMNVPLRQLKELGIHYIDGAPVISYYDIVPTTITSINASATGATAITNVTDLRAVTTTEVVNIYVEKKDEPITADVDLDKPLIDQDWALVVTDTTAFQSAVLYAEELDLSETTVISTTDPEALEVLKVMARSTQGISFMGTRSMKKYSPAQVLSLSSSLSAIWGKVKNIKLPTPTHLATGTALLSNGLAAIGQITGAAGWQTASNVASCISQGLGAFVKPPDPSRNVEIPAVDPNAQIERHVYNIVPSLISAGQARLEQDSSPAVGRRIKLSGIKNNIISAYTTASSPTTVAFSSNSNGTITERVNKLKTRVKQQIKQGMNRR